MRRLGAVYGPYTGTCFASTRRTDIEHMVATSEAHDSGLCARDRATRARFASDTAADTATRKAARTPPSGYRTATGAGSRPGLWKSGVPTISRLTGARLKSWSGCENVAMEPLVCHAEEGADQSLAVSSGDDALARYDDNGNGRITCREARRHGIAPVRWDHPAYRHMRDGDGDGVVCE